MPSTAQTLPSRSIWCAPVPALGGGVPAPCGERCALRHGVACAARRGGSARVGAAAAGAARSGGAPAARRQACLGDIYDVTKGKDFYGPDGPYNKFAGRCAAEGRALPCVR